MSTANQITVGELMGPANRRKFLSYLGAAPALTAFAGVGLLSSPRAFAATGPPNARSGVTGRLDISGLGVDTRGGVLDFGWRVA
jgi:hypothetical protein